MAQKRRSLYVLPLIVLLCSIAGGFYGPQVQAEPAGASETEELDQDVANLTKVLALVEQNFADPVNADKAIYKGVIPGMLRTLDPHSNFFDPKEYEALREEQRGRYSGVGMTVQSRNGKTVVQAPFPGSPAYKAGLRAGDIIVMVNDRPTDGLSTTDIAVLLKGPRGTQVKIVVSRERSADDFIVVSHEGSADNLTFTVTRDDISRKSVEDAFWVKPGIAYIKILSFAETTSHELEENLKRLGENNIKGLVLDLRDNPGGILNQGVDVADHFLEKGALIVSHHGRSSPEKSYVARNGNHGHEYPIVVLVDGYSASAAEIVAGALQDHDRAWIMGTKTFGKGLVQTVYPLTENTGLALTTAHFYTPSGRLIQRDYTNQSFYDYYFHKDDDARNPLDVKMTEGGRTVYGGGGITPDEKYEAPKMDRLELELGRSALFNFARWYFGSHSTSLPKGWMPDTAFLEELHDYVLKHGTNFTESEFMQDREWITRYLAREMYITAFNLDESDRIFSQTDPEVAKAVDAMPKASALLETTKKIIVQRMNAQQQQRSAAAARR